MRLKIKHIAPYLRFKVKAAKRPWPKQAQQKCAKHKGLKPETVMDKDMITDNEMEEKNMDVEAEAEEEEFCLNDNNAKSYIKKENKHFISKGLVKNYYKFN